MPTDARRAYYAARAARPRAQRGSGIRVNRLPQYVLEQHRLAHEAEGPLHYDRPNTRAECSGGPRPCPFVSCAHHLYLDVSPRTGSIKLNFPDLEVDEMKESCALDVADRGGAPLEEVGAMLNLTRERVRQIEVAGVGAVRASPRAPGLREHIDVAKTAARGRRRLPIAG